MDEQNKMNPAMNLHIYFQIIFKNGSKIIQWEKGQPFQQIFLGKLDIHMQKKEVASLSNIVFKIQLKVDEILKQETLSIKPLEDNIRQKIHDIGLVSGSFDMTPKNRQ